jgi:4-hydroxybenzoate polyprenyltransferase
MEKLRRLWQPSHPLFWLMLAFNGLSSLCSWALRALPLNTLGLLLVGTIALANLAAGLLAAWKLMQGNRSTKP